MFFLHPYIRSGILLHLVTAIEITLLAIAYYWLSALNWFVNDAYLLKHLLWTCFLSFPLFPQFDAYSRYQNYKQLVDLFYFNGFDKRFVKPFIKSRCQRDAVMAAALDLGYHKKCKAIFTSSGYQWYHFFPDFMLSNPSFLFHKHFWLTTFFTRKYVSKVNKKIIVEFRNHNLAQLLAA